ncbi:hypothetical protein CTAYLR_010435 [Chrysophaeum taylorii]|uniref:SET domain-containing protein n=1 Tax=Chrysophaeum taylorii TaxID=2483200 RepID=A0AAD7XKH5_9STRA|nr:hypothetical protein CTAYLR_010435 [Chrysophaeum taylorii]
MVLNVLVAIINDSYHDGHSARYFWRTRPRDVRRLRVATEDALERNDDVKKIVRDEVAQRPRDAAPRDLELSFSASLRSTTRKRGTRWDAAAFDDLRATLEPRATLHLDDEPHPQCEACSRKATTRGGVALDGARVSVDPRLGRTIVATRSWGIGEEILREFPVLTWRGGAVEFLEAFAKSNEAVRELVLRMWAPPRLEESTWGLVSSRRADAARITLGHRLFRKKKKGRAASLDFELVHRLLVIMDLNCHDYIAEGTAMFTTASKMAHSCLPNARFALSVSGELVYTAIRPIKKGDHITFNYNGAHAWFVARRERRAAMLERYGFECRCRRCEAPDALRTARCPTCGSAALLVEDNGGWRCVGSCGTLDRAASEAILRTERRADDEIARLRARAEEGPNASPRVAVVAKAGDDLARSLSWTHVSVARSRQLQIKLGLSVLALKRRVRDLDLPNVLFDAADDDRSYGAIVDASFDLVRIGETHPAIYENTWIVHRAAKCIFDRGIRKRRYLPMLVKYTALLRLMLDDGVDDDVVLKGIAAALGSVGGSDDSAIPISPIVVGGKATNRSLEVVLPAARGSS